MSEQSIHQLHMKRLKGLLELFSRRLIVCFKSHRDQSAVTIEFLVSRRGRSIASNGAICHRDWCFE
jgi:hypothetical protein